MLDVLHKQSVSRVPCLAMAHAMYSTPQHKRHLDAQSVFFVVDPDNNLSNTAKRITPVVNARPLWSGTISTAPSKKVIDQALREQDIYLYVFCGLTQVFLWHDCGSYCRYCGHGAGVNLLPPFEKVQCNSVSILVGCSSSNINKLGTFWESHGAPINFMLSGRYALFSND